MIKRILYILLATLILVGCSYPKNYRDFNYNGYYFIPETSEMIPIQCTFIKYEGLDAFRVFQLDEAGEVISGYGTDLTSYTQEKEHLRFKDTEVILKGKDGKIYHDMVNSGIVGKGHIMLFGFRHKADAKITTLTFDKGEKNILSQYFK